MKLATVTVAGGRKIELAIVELSRTYGGMIEGYPHASNNDAHLRYVRAKLEQRYARLPSVVLEPTRTLRPERNFADSPPWEEFPPVECLGFFTSTPMSRAPEYDLGDSCLAVAWWQEHDGAVLSESARPAFATLDWEAAAQDRPGDY